MIPILKNRNYITAEYQFGHPVMFKLSILMHIDMKEEFALQSLTKRIFVETFHNVLKHSFRHPVMFQRCIFLHIDMKRVCFAKV